MNYNSNYSSKNFYKNNISSNTRLVRYYFYTFFVKIYYFLLVIFSVLILVITNSNKELNLFIRDKIYFISKPIAKTAHIPFNLFSDFILSVKDLTLTYIENKELKEKNIFLKKTYLEYLKTKQENENLKKMLNFVDDIKINYDFITSKIYLSPKTNINNFFILNIGKKQNIKEGSVILGKKNGVIGRVVNINDDYSDVLLLTNINSKIPAYTLKTNEKLILSGTNKDFLEIAFFNSKELVLEDGDLVYTLGDSNIIPNGLYIGKIKKIKDEYFVELDENINQSSVVFVVKPKY